MVIWCRAGTSSPNVKGHFTPEDIRQIRRVVQHDRWSILMSTVGGGTFKSSFNIWMADIAFARVVEIGPCDPPFVINGVIVTNAVGAYVLSRGVFQNRTLKYQLAQTAAGWRTTSIVLSR